MNSDDKTVLIVLIIIITFFAYCITSYFSNGSTSIDTDLQFKKVELEPKSLEGFDD